jgi:hypothetical protein
MAKKYLGLCVHKIFLKISINDNINFSQSFPEHREFPLRPAISQQSVRSRRR